MMDSVRLSPAASAVSRWFGARWIAVAALIAALLPGGGAVTSSYGEEAIAPDLERMKRGEAIYRKQCLECHGEQGEGVEDKADDPLYGNRNLESLAGRIERTMPEDKAELCVGEDARDVAEYVYHSFYSLAARARNQPSRPDLTRLTVNQYRTSVADLVGFFRGGYGKPLPAERGLQATYTGTKEFPDPKDEKKKKTKKEHHKSRDSGIHFDFGEALPGPLRDKGYLDRQFEVKWEGSVVPEFTGEYEFVLRTRNGARLYVNQQAWWDNKRGVTADIDAQVASNNEMREERCRVFLLGGRAYPIALTYFKYKEKHASVELLWKPPHGALETIPERSLIPHYVPESHLVETAFPADDRSVGYERGSAVSRTWLDAVTAGAIDTADYVSTYLHELAGTKKKKPEEVREGVRRFSRQFVELAFRRPLADPEWEHLRKTFLENAESPEQGVKRLTLFTLTSPRFLYPEAGIASGAEGDKAAAHAVAARLGLILWDSLPDRQLVDAARQGHLARPDQIEKQVHRMLGDARARAKMRGFFEHWLELERAQELSKDSERFPDFDQALLADLRQSLFLFIDDVVWGDRSDYRELLLSDTLYLNNRLAALYGSGAGKDKLAEMGAAFRPIKVDPKRRSGVITHPYLLTAFAYHNNSSPIHRGVFLTRNIVGMVLKPPPEAIEFEDSRFDPSLTMREKVTELTRDQACMACHGTINPLGFSLEHFDAIGRWRVKDNDKPIDPVSDFITGAGDKIRLKGARDVAQFAATDPAAHRAFVNQLFNHFVKQPAEAYGVETAGRLGDGFVNSEFNIRELLVRIALTATSGEATGSGKAVTLATSKTESENAP